MDNGNGDETAFDDERNFSCPPAILFFLFFISSSWSGHYFWTLRQVFSPVYVTLSRIFLNTLGNPYLRIFKRFIVSKWISGFTFKDSNDTGQSK